MTRDVVGLGWYLKILDEFGPVPTLSRKPKMYAKAEVVVEENAMIP